MKRRQFVQRGAAPRRSRRFPRPSARRSRCSSPFAPLPGPWRTYEITTTIELVAAQGPAQAWIPLPAFAQPNWIRPQPPRRMWTNATTATIARGDAASGTQMLYAQWASNTPIPSIELVSRAATRDRTIDFKKPGTAADLSPADRAPHYTAATASIPAPRRDRQEHRRAQAVAAITETELATRAIYDWVIERTVRGPNTPELRERERQAMLQSSKPAGKSADINASSTSAWRARAACLRVLYSIRTSPSSFYYKSLGPGGSGILREAGPLAPRSFCRVSAGCRSIRRPSAKSSSRNRRVIWRPTRSSSPTRGRPSSAPGETNWVAYNDGQDVPLPGSGRPPLPFLIYPQAQVNGTPLDPLKPDGFRYAISAREIT